MKLFEKPWLEVIKLDIEDVITISDNTAGGYDPEEGPISGVDGAGGEG